VISGIWMKSCSALAVYTITCGEDQDGHIFGILMQRRRDKVAAKKFFRKLLKVCRYAPRVIITDQLKSYGAAKREVSPGVNTVSTAI
jgi:transposase-like protein